ncbi:MAG: glycosyltransferase [Candidatus Peribacteraceae bacterium]|nr:glycosyltransferase [Candidatus Peribacteraceae bacterium]
MSQTDNFPFVSVIIPVKNGADRLRLCLEALRQQTYPRHMYEIIVADNDSTDDIASVARANPGVCFVHEKLPGPAAARNAGVAQAKGEMLAFTDADCIPKPEWIAEGVCALEHAQIIGGRIDVIPPRSHAPSVIEKYSYATSFRQHHFVNNNSFAATGNIFMRRNTWAAVGPFDARLIAHEDVEFCHRAKKKGIETVYAHAAVVTHPIHYSNVASLLRKVAYHTRGSVQYWRLQGGHTMPLFSALLKDIFPIDALSRTTSRRREVGCMRMPILLIATIRIFLFGPIQFFSRLYFAAQGNRIFMRQYAPPEKGI